MVIVSLLREFNEKGYNSECFAGDLLILLMKLFEGTLCCLMNTAFSVIKVVYRTRIQRLSTSSFYEQNANPTVTAALETLQQVISLDLLIEQTLVNQR